MASKHMKPSVKQLVAKINQQTAIIRQLQKELKNERAKNRGPKLISRSTPDLRYETDEEWRKRVFAHDYKEWQDAKATYDKKAIKVQSCLPKRGLGRHGQIMGTPGTPCTCDCQFNPWLCGRSAVWGGPPPADESQKCEININEPFLPFQELEEPRWEAYQNRIYRGDNFYMADKKKKLVPM